MKRKFIIITTVPISLGFFKGQLQVLKSTFDVEVISSPGEMLDEICRKEQVKGRAVTMKREINVFYDVVSLIKLAMLFAKLKPEIVHGSTPKAGLLSMIASWANRVPIRIYYIHGLRYQGFKGIKRRLLMYMEKLSCFFATHVYAVSYGVKEIVAQEKITKKQIKMIGNGSINGIDVAFFSPFNQEVPNLRKQYKIKSTAIVYGFVGRLVRDKGINELIQAFLKIYAKTPEARLLLVGNFEEGDLLDMNIKEEIITNSAIINVGFQKDVRPFFKMMTVFVFPSYREGFGVSLMEAAAMGVPAISSNIIGCNEIIKEGYNGVLIPPKSVEALLKAMEMVLVNKDKIDEMSLVCRSYVEEKYEQKKVWEAILEEYKSLEVS